MFTINGTDYTIVVIGAIGALLFFGLQFLFFRAKRTAVKLIPVYLILLCAVYCAAMYAGLFGTSSMGVLAGHEIVALICAVVVGIASVGVALAWLVFGLTRGKRKNRQPQQTVPIETGDIWEISDKE